MNHRTHVDDAEFAASKARRAEASNAKIMDAFAQARDEALADLAAVQVQARMDMQAMRAERDAALHLECAVAGMLRETEVALAVVTAERDAALARIELLEYDMKTGDYETLYAQVVVELAAMTAERDATLAENAILARYRLSLSDALAERDAALAGMEKQADFIVALADRIDSVEAEALKLRADLAAAQKVPT